MLCLYNVLRLVPKNEYSVKYILFPPLHCSWKLATIRENSKVILLSLSGTNSFGCLSYLQMFEGRMNSSIYYQIAGETIGILFISKLSLLSTNCYECNDSTLRTCIAVEH